MTELDRRISGYARSVRELLGNKRYGLEYYQREYSWGREQVEELINDLTLRFLEQWDEVHTRKSVANYREYFLGPIITSDRDGTTYLIDGQQRLTTLTLLLVVLLRQLEDEGLRATVRTLIHSEEYGERSLTLDVPEREAAFEALLEGNPYDSSSASSSVQTVVERYSDLEELFDVGDSQVPLFTEWLLGKVILVEIIAPESQMAYDIFETMNDRGLRLTPTDMLKGFLLANVGDDRSINLADDFWRKRVHELAETGKDAESDFFKAWLRAHYAESIRERKKGATPEDWDLIGSQFHKWVRDNTDTLTLKAPHDFNVLVTTAFDRMSRHYLRLIEATRRLTPGLEHVRYGAVTGFSLQLTVALSPVTIDDDDATANRKMDLVAQALDIFVARRISNYRNFSYSGTVYTMFQWAKRIRHAPLSELPELLIADLGDDEDAFEDGAFGLHMRNGPRVKYLLARLTDELHRACHNSSMFDDLVNRRAKDPYEIEHVWANHSEQHRHEVDESEFSSVRNRLGDLLLLPKSFNASYGDLPYEEKLPHYRGQNILAACLHPDTYRHNPNLRRVIEQTGWPLEPHEAFPRSAIDQRQDLYLSMAATIWSPDRLRNG